MKTRIDRELDYTATEVLSHVQRQQAVIANANLKNLLAFTRDGIEDSNSQINQRGLQLSKEMALRYQKKLIDFVNFQVANQQGNNAASILGNHQLIEAAYARPVPVVTTNKENKGNKGKPNGAANTIPSNAMARLYVDNEDETRVIYDPKAVLDNFILAGGSPETLAAYQARIIVDNLLLANGARGTFVDLIDFASMDGDIARLAQLVILDLLDTSLSSDIAGNRIGTDLPPDTTMPPLDRAAGWTNEQIAEAYAGISLTVDALADLARSGGVPLQDLSGTVSSIYTKWVGPTEIRLVDETGVSNVINELHALNE